MTQDHQTGLPCDLQGSTTQIANDQAAGVVHSAARSGAQLVDEAVRSFGEELHSMARGSSEPGMASDLAQQVGSRADAVKAFAPDKPGTFLAVAAGVGLLAGRLTRGIKDASDDPVPTYGLESESTPGAYSASGVSGDAPGGYGAGDHAATRKEEGVAQVQSVKSDASDAKDEVQQQHSHSQY